MSSGEVLYTFRVSHLDVLQLGRQQVVEMRAYRDGALAEPTSGTFTLYKPDGTKIVDAAAVTVTASVAKYTLTTTHLPTTLTPLGELYLEEWALVMPDGTTRTVRREAALARRMLYPTVTDADLTARYPDLLTQLGTTGTSFQSYIDAAWGRLIRELVRRGVLHYLIVGSDALHDWLEHMVLTDVYWSFFRGAGGDRWKILAERHEKLADTASNHANFTLDKDHDGRADSSDRESKTAIVHQNAAPTPGLARSRQW